MKTINLLLAVCAGSAVVVPAESCAQSVIVAPAPDELFTEEVAEKFSFYKPMVVVASQFQGNPKKPQVGDLVKIWREGRLSEDMKAIATFSGFYSRKPGSKTLALFYRPSTKKDFFVWIRNSEMADQNSAYLSTETIISKEFTSFSGGVSTGSGQSSPGRMMAAPNDKLAPVGQPANAVRKTLVAATTQVVTRGAYKWKVVANPGDEVEIAMQSSQASTMSVRFCAIVPKRQTLCYGPGNGLLNAPAKVALTYNYVAPPAGAKVEIEVRNYSSDYRSELPFTVTPSVRPLIVNKDWQSNFGFLFGRNYMSVENKDGIQKYVIRRWTLEQDGTVAVHQQVEGGSEEILGHYEKSADGTIVLTLVDGASGRVRFVRDGVLQVYHPAERQTLSDVDGKIVIAVDRPFFSSNDTVAILANVGSTSRTPITPEVSAQIMREGPARIAAIEAKMARWGALATVAKVGRWSRSKNYPSVRNPDATTSWRAFRTFTWTDPGAEMSMVYYGPFGDMEDAYALTMSEDGTISSKQVTTGKTWTYAVMDGGWRYEEPAAKGGFVEQRISADGATLRMNEGRDNAASVLRVEQAMQPAAVAALIKEQKTTYAEYKAQWERELKEQARQQRANERSAAFANAMGAIADVVAQSNGTTGSTGIWDPNNPGTRALQETIARVNAETAAKQQAERQAALDRYAQAARERAQVASARSRSETAPRIAAQPAAPTSPPERIANPPYNARRTFTSSPGAFTATDTADGQSKRIAATAPPPPKVTDVPVEWKEGITLCKAAESGKGSWRCEGPLQLTYAKIDERSGEGDLGNACGTSFDKMRDLGMVQGYRAFGCGYGIHPTDRVYPGNNDVPAKLGVGDVPGRLTFRCVTTKNAYCRDN